MLLGNLMQAAYNTVDSIWVGRVLGPQALASVAVGHPIVFAMIALVTGLGVATTALVSQYYGARENDLVRATIANSITLMAVLGVGISLVGYVLRWPLLRVLRAPEDIIYTAATYLGVYAAGFLPTFLYNVASAVLRGLGDSRTPLRFLAYATIMNIILDPIFIFGLGPLPRMGVAGAAWATVISQSFAAVAALIYLVKPSRLIDASWHLLSLDARLTRATIRIGVPAGAQQTLVSLGMMAVMSLVNRFGSATTAAFGTGNRIDQFAFMPSVSIGLAVTALVGQNLGAGRDDRVPLIVRWGLALACSITGVVALVALAFPRILVSLFTTDAEVLSIGSSYLRHLGVAYVGFAAYHVLTGVMRGAGDTMPTFFITLAGLWLVRIPLAAYLSSSSALGTRGIWIAMTVGYFVALGLGYTYYRTGRWKTRTMIRRSQIPDGPGPATGESAAASD
jgi:putative MATE family efflux protein